jgi:putative FmdB family regulatory protein
MDSRGSCAYFPGMPTYEYEVCDGDCTICGGRFELKRPMDREPLTECPLCKKPVRKAFSNFNAPTKTKLSVVDAKKAGFKIYKKIGQGEYERQ